MGIWKRWIFKKEEFQSLNIVKSQHFSGSKILEKNGISISRELGYDLYLKVGDKLSLVFSSFEETLIGSLPKQKTFKIISFYNTGFDDFDKNIVFKNIEDLEKQPAYKRRGVEIDSTEKAISKSKTSLTKDDDDDIQPKSSNSFLHDNVD